MLLNTWELIVIILISFYCGIVTHFLFVSGKINKVLIILLRKKTENEHGYMKIDDQSMEEFMNNLDVENIEFAYE